MGLKLVVLYRGIQFAGCCNWERISFRRIHRFLNHLIRDWRVQVISQEVHQSSSSSLLSFPCPKVHPYRLLYLCSKGRLSFANPIGKVFSVGALETRVFVWFFGWDGLGQRWFFENLSCWEEWFLSLYPCCRRSDYPFPAWRVMMSSTRPRG